MEPLQSGTGVKVLVVGICGSVQSYDLDLNQSYAMIYLFIMLQGNVQWQDQCGRETLSAVQTHSGFSPRRLLPGTWFYYYNILGKCITHVYD